MAKNKELSSYGLKVPLDVPIDILNTMIQYIFTANPQITRKSLGSLREFFHIMDTRMYENDDEMMSRIHFVKKSLNCKLVLNIHDPTLMVEAARGGQYDEEIDNAIVPAIENGYDLSTEDAMFINGYVSERLKYSYIFAYSEPLQQVMEDLQVGNYESIYDINARFKEILVKLNNHIRRAEVEDEFSAYVDLTPDNFRNMVMEYVEELRKPTNFLKTGLQYFNEMLKGGFENGRFYLFLGASGGFKSGILLSIVRWIRQYNRGFETKDPNKTPCVVYVTQENSLRETIERLFNISVTGEDIRNYTPDEVVAMMLETGEMDIKVNNINIRMLYRPNRSISTDDLYSILDEIEEEGQEVIALVHDYVKRIRSANPNKELRLELGNIVDEMTVIAKTRNIPVISASQINRAGVTVIEEAMASGQEDIGKKLGGSNVGESWAMIENADWVGIINREYKQATDTWYLSIKQIKTRAKNPTLTYFAHPFEKDNGMKLVDDFDEKEPVSLKNISGEDMTTSTNLGSRGRRSARNPSSAGPMETAGGPNDEFEGLE